MNKLCNFCQGRSIHSCLHISLNKIRFHLTGFVFSDSESTALEQFEGGPCAVIAPVQVRCLYCRNGVKLVSQKFVLHIFGVKINIKKLQISCILIS